MVSSFANEIACGSLAYALSNAMSLADVPGVRKSWTMCFFHGGGQVTYPGLEIWEVIQPDSSSRSREKQTSSSLLFQEDIKNLNKLTSATNTALESSNGLTGENTEEQ
jgi:hypothetical protein